MDTQKLCILGSTGSIGTQALEVASHLDITVDAISANSNTKLLEQQIRKYSPRFCAVTNEDAAKDLKIAVADTNCTVLSGKDASCEIIEKTDADTVLNSIIGFAGLEPTLCAIRAKKNLAIANK